MHSLNLTAEYYVRTTYVSKNDFLGTFQIYYIIKVQDNQRWR
jgi:hypothetical protein